MSSYICTLCMDLLMEPRKIAAEKTVRDYHAVGIYCGHLFHQFCLSTALASRKDAEMPLTCPVCQELIDEVDIVKIYPTLNSEGEDYYDILKKYDKIMRDQGIIKKETQVLKAQIVQIKALEDEHEEKMKKMSQQIENLKDHLALEELHPKKDNRGSLNRKDKRLHKMCAEAQAQETLAKEVKSADEFEAIFDRLSVILSIEDNNEEGVPGHSENNISRTGNTAERMLEKIRQLLM